MLVCAGFRSAFLNQNSSTTFLKVIHAFIKGLVLTKKGGDEKDDSMERFELNESLLSFSFWGQCFLALALCPPKRHSTLQQLLATCPHDVKSWISGQAVRHWPAEDTNLRQPVCPPCVFC
eukprot:3976778-Amphidinium_carterae.2